MRNKLLWSSTSLRLLTSMLLLCASSAAPAAELTNALVIVVNKASFTMMLSTSDIKQIYLGERAKWPDGKKIVPLMLSPVHPEFRGLLKAGLGMSEAEFKRYLMQANFTGKDVTPPRMLDSASAIKQYVSATPGAIGCLRASDVDDSVRAVKVDGSSAGDAGYKLVLAP